MTGNDFLKAVGDAVVNFHNGIRLEKSPSTFSFFTGTPVDIPNVFPVENITAEALAPWVSEALDVSMGNLKALEVLTEHTMKQISKLNKEVIFLSFCTGICIGGVYILYKKTKVNEAKIAELEARLKPHAI